jgi:hypothetical protein
MFFSQEALVAAKKAKDEAAARPPATAEIAVPE